jgi:GAF domain-containing protein
MPTASGLLSLAATPGSARAMRGLAQALASEAAGAVGADRCVLLALRARRLVVLAAIGPDAETSRPALPLGGVAAAVQAVRERRPVLVAAGTLPAALALPRAGAVLFVPLLRDGRRLGLLLFGATGRDLGEREAALAAAVARPVAHVLRLVSASRRAAPRLRAARTLLRVSRSLGASLELNDVMQRLAREATRAVRADSAGIYVLNGAGRSLELVAAHHARDDATRRGRSPAPIARSRASSRPPTAARCCSTRSARCRCACRPSSCTCSRMASSPGWGARR